MEVLPVHEELFKCLELFQRRAQPCSFPHTPHEITKREVERFLEDKERNANQFPDMLALLFATLACGLQMGQYDKNGGQWVQGAVEATRNLRSDPFRNNIPNSVTSVNEADLSNSRCQHASATYCIFHESTYAARD